MDSLKAFFLSISDLGLAKIALLIFGLLIFLSFTISFLRNPKEFFRVLIRLLDGFFIPVGSVESQTIKLSQLAEEMAVLVKKEVDSRLDEKKDQGRSVKEDDAMRTEVKTAEEPAPILYDLSKNSFPNLAYRLSKPSTMLMETISWKLNKPDPEQSVQDLIAMHSSVVEEETRWRQQEKLEEVFDQQLASSTRIRSLMINLFVFVNFAVICFILFRPEQVLNSRELVFGLYISFATFMVYVFRSANARALIILAGQEDLKRYHDAEKYIRLLRDREVSEKDIDVLKLLLLNRMEREKNGEHPYELVLKGISNSNILFKGGKVSATPSKEKAKKNEE